MADMQVYLLVIKKQLSDNVYGGTTKRQSAVDNIYVCISTWLSEGQSIHKQVLFFMARDYLKQKRGLFSKC